MPKNKDLKRLVRVRMEKTGESYATARAHITKSNAKIPVAEYADAAGMSDAAAVKATGLTWKEWVQRLDKSNAHKLDHRDIVSEVLKVPGVSDWWAQMVTVGYERIKGLREKGQRRGGNYEISKSKTLGIPLRDLYRAFADARLRKQWLGNVEIKVRKNNADKSVRWLWEDGTPVEVYFTEKGPRKAQAQLQHRDLPSKAVAEKVRTAWTNRLADLAVWAAER